MFQIGGHNHVIGREKSCYALACDICESVGTSGGGGKNPLIPAKVWRSNCFAIESRSDRNGRRLPGKNWVPASAGTSGG
jgi:hypothetical protein